jgi:hypothetical protein
MSDPWRNFKYMFQTVSPPADISTTPPDDKVPTERLEAQICELAGHLTAACCQFLLLVGEFDARGGWESWSLPSCSAWLAWKCSLSPGTAREQVRVARALRELPVIRAGFAAGRLSYSKVRALTRIATPLTEAGLVDLAGPMTGGQLDRFARAHRRVSRAEDKEVREARRVTWRWDEDDSLVLTARLPPAAGQVILQALRAAADDLEHPHRPQSDDQASPEDISAPSNSAPPKARTKPAPASSLADALTGLASDYLAGKISAAANPDLYQVIVHVGPEALTGDHASAPESAAGRSPYSSSGNPCASAEAPSPVGGFHPAAEQGPGTSPAGTSPATPHASAEAAADPDADRPLRPVGHPASPDRCHIEDGPALSPAAAQRIACSATVSWMLHDHAGNLLDVGRRHRKPPPALRRAVRERDQYRCRFPGCHSRRTDIHHIRHWARGGKTRLSNLILLCEAHHVIVHELGYQITLADDGRGFTFTQADGTALPAAPPPSLPAPCNIAACHQATITPTTVGGSGDRLDLHLAIWAAFANASLAERRQAQPA